MDGDCPESSTEERDQFRRSVKKSKRLATDEPLIDAMEEIVAEEAPGKSSWASLVRSSEEKLEIYCGEDEDDDTLNEFLAHYDMKMAELANEVAEGQTHIDVPIEKCKRLWQPWRRAIVVKVLGKQLSFRVLERRLTELWAFGGKLEIIDLPHDYYVVRFYSAAHYWNALCNDPWMIQGHYITVRKWKPLFSPARETITSTLAWIRVPELPLEYFDEECLLQFGGVIGKAIRVDDTTMQVSRGKFARVCVKIDLAKPLTARIIVNGVSYAVEYEGLSRICFQCGWYGHVSDDCGRDAADNGIRSGIKTCLGSGPRTTDPFGPWMIVSNPRRRRQNVVGEQFGFVQRAATNAEGNMKENNTTMASTGNGNSKGWGKGSRFDMLNGLEPEMDEGDQEEVLAAGLRNITDKGPTVIFRTNDKATSIRVQGRGRRGISVRSNPRSKPTIQNRIREDVNVSTTNNNLRTSGGLMSSSRGGSSRGRGTARGTRGGFANISSLRDITNVVTGGTMKSLGNMESLEEWPALVAKPRTAHFEDRGNVTNINPLTS